MTQFDYDELYKPYTHGTHTLSATIDWMMKTAKIDRDICNHAVADTMLLISQGAIFPLPCPCGCGFDLPNATIDHYMLARAAQLSKQISDSKVKILGDVEKLRLEARQKALSNFDKEYSKMKFGTWADRNVPTFKRWFSRK